MLRLVGEAPDLIVVQGDTSSALGGSRAAAALGIPLAHVEAGLRSHDLALPWPEEEYRVAIDAASDLLFAPTGGAAANLRRESVAGEIHVTGNTSVDALLEVERLLPSPKVSDSGSPHILVTCHRRESWEAGLSGVMAAVCELAARGSARFHILLHPNSHVSGRIRSGTASCPNLTLIEPCGHSEMIQHMCRSNLVLSDSGGIQEEAPSLGIPLLVLRDKTERPEGLATGNMRLVGTEPGRIIAAVEQLLADPVARAAMSRRTYPYGDGHAGPRIAAIVENWLARRSRARLQRA